MSINDYYESSDIAQVATFHYFGAKIEAIDRSDPSRAVFHIKREKPLDGLVQGYWAGELRVEPQGYFNALKNVKARLYNA
jgi:hypothetical protein